MKIGSFPLGIPNWKLNTLEVSGELVSAVTATVASSHI